jgi:hypothetical protein
MKELKPYWFLESTIDIEYKYYILMAYLTKVEKSFKTREFEKNFKNLITIKKDLESFDKNTELSQNTLAKMTNHERSQMYTILDNNLDQIENIGEIVKNSIKVIDKFFNDNKEFYERYNSLVDIESYCAKYNLWDQGFLIIRRRGEEFMKIFTWFFSIIKIEDKENIALLMTELLNPRCNTTKDINSIRKFLKENIKDFSSQYDCVLVAEVSKEIDIEIGTELGKEKSINIIMNKFKN